MVPWTDNAQEHPVSGTRIRQQDEQKAMVDLVQRWKDKYPLPGQIIVYCGTVARTVERAGELGGVCYHREVGA